MFGGIETLHISKMYPPEIGGVETVCRQYAQISAELGRTIVFTTSGKAGFGWQQEQDGNVTIIRFHHQLVILQLRLSLIMLLALVLARFGSMTIHIHEPYPVASFVFGLLPCDRLIVTWHSDLYRHRAIAWMIEWLQQRAMRRAKAVTVTSPMLAENSPQIATIKDREKIHIVPLFLDKLPEFGEDCGRLSELPGFDDFIHENPKYALFLGRFSYYKGLNVLLDALGLLAAKGIRLPVIIAGTGEEEYRLGTIAEMAGVFIISSYLDEREKNWLLGHAEVFLFPSTFASEAFGIMQLEALGLGTPVINSALPTAVPWVSLDGETGLTVRPNDPEALAEAMLGFFSGRTSKAHFSANCQARLERLFSKGDQRRKLVRLYQPTPPAG